MKICFICSNLWPYTYGGAERRYYEFARELIRRGYHTIYITYNWGPSEIPIAPIGNPPVLYDKEGRRRIITELMFGLKAAKKAREIRCDVYDVTVPYTEAFFLPRKNMILTLLEYWGRKWLEYYGKIPGRLIAYAEKRLVKRPATIIVLTHFIANKIRHIRPDVTVLPFGINLQEYLPHRTQKKEYDLAWIGRFVRYKGVVEFMELLKEIETPLRVVIIGDGPLYPKIAQMKAAMKHDIDIIKRATEEEKKLILAKTRIYINNSSGEGFSISTLEAIALGAYPIVYAANGYNAAVELIEKLEYGTIINDMPELPRIVKLLLSTTLPTIEPERLKTYDITTIVDQYEKILRYSLHL